MWKNTLIIALALSVLFLSYRLVGVENQRYALLLGMCPSNIHPVDLACLETVQTRTHWLWHLYYGIRG
jgi:predicted Kef-type K+ transport protein